MYIVNQISGFSLDGGYAKVHYVSNSSIAAEVKADLELRFGSMETTEAKHKKATYDPGGMLMMNDKVFDFDLGDMVVSCKAQHLSYFVSHLKSYQPRGNQTKYVKIHGHYDCICITPEEFEQLKALANDPKLTAQAQQAEENREQRIQGLVDDGHLIRAAKDAAGNVVDIDKLAAKAKGNN